MINRECKKKKSISNKNISKFNYFSKSQRFWFWIKIHEIKKHTSKTYGMEKLKVKHQKNYIITNLKKVCISKINVRCPMY